MALKFSTAAGLAIAALVTAWFAYGTFVRTDKADVTAGDAAPTFRVVARDVSPTAFDGALTVRGRTRAEAKIVVRADASGQVTATPAREGARVKKGEALCRLDRETRGAQAREAAAALAKARIDFEAGEKLAAEGYRSEAGLAGLKAARDGAQAAYDAASLALEKTDIVAPFDGIFDRRDARVGDLMKPGDPCGVVIRDDPFVVEGAVAEADIARVRVGDKGVAQLATGESVEGVVRFVAQAADAATRTFRVELEIPNPDGLLRDGVTADFTVTGLPIEAHLAPRSALTLDDAGRVGVKTVGADGRVIFTPVRLAGETEGGVYVIGLKGRVSLIVRGQDFVAEGEPVEVAEAGA
jgi:multidrug efflux system membrane fusion protein